MNCLSCTAETSNGLALCGLCMRKVEADLQYLPVYFSNLARQRRPARPNGSLGTSGDWLIRRGEEEGSRVFAALDRAGNDLSTWARCLAEDRDLELPDVGDTEAEQVEALCAWLTEHLTSIATLEWAGEFVRSIYAKGADSQGIGYHEGQLRGLTETTVPGWYAGGCRRCAADTYVIPGFTWVTCGRCGATTYARDHLDVILKEARDWQARPKALAEAIVALVDTEPSVPRLHDRIRKWDSLEWLTPTRRLDRDGDPVGPKRYRFGDVLDLVLGEADAPTRAKRASTA